MGSTQDFWEFVDSNADVAPAGRGRMRLKGGVLQQSVNGGPWTAAGGGTCPLVLASEILIGTSGSPYNVEVASVTFSGLSGDVDNTYMLQIDGIGGSDSSVSSGVVWTLNGGLGTMSYLGSKVSGLAGGVIAGFGSTTLAILGLAAATGNHWGIKGLIYAKTGRQREALTEWGLWDATANANQMGQNASRCSDTATAITSMTIASTGVKIFGVGSRIRLWTMPTTV